MMKIILFEDSNIENLYPITLTRPGFDILCGGITLLDLLKKQFKPAKIDFLVRDYFKKICVKKYSPCTKSDSKILFLNSDLVPSFEAIKSLSQKISRVEGIVFKNKDQVLGAFIDLNKRGKIKNLKHLEVINFLTNLQLKVEKVNWQNFHYPHEIIKFNQEILLENLKYLKNDFAKYQPEVFIGKKVKIEAPVSFDTTQGPIIIGDGSQIKSFSVLRGPLFIGQNCVVNSFAEIKGHSCIGRVCKIGGEVEAAVIQGYSNKQHHGFLGHSYIGEWVNIGAGTSNSDLKNNYGLVKMGGQDTGMQFLGCIIGDYSKTAINTSIFTGKIIGVNSFLYGTIVDNVTSFTNCASQLGCTVEFLLDAAIVAQKAMMARRKIKPTRADIKLLENVYDLTKIDREEAKVAKGKLFFK